VTERDIIYKISHLNRLSQIHVIHIFSKFSLSVADTYDISVKYFYSSFSFGIKMQNNVCSDHNINHSVCGVPSVLWGLLLVQQGNS